MTTVPLACASLLILKGGVLRPSNLGSALFFFCGIGYEGEDWEEEQQRGSRGAAEGQRGRTEEEYNINFGDAFVAAPCFALLCFALRRK